MGCPGPWAHVGQLQGRARAEQGGESQLPLGDGGLPALSVCRGRRGCDGGRKTHTVCVVELEDEVGWRAEKAGAEVWL